MSCESTAGAGELDKRVIIQYKAKYRNAYGEEVAAWLNLKTVWASIKPVATGKEVYVAKQLHAESNMKVRIRYFNGLTTTMRVLFGVRELDILHIQNTNEANIELVLWCKEVL